MPRGKEVRCHGYTSDDGKWCFCARVSNGSHHEVESAAGPLFAHLLRDEPIQHDPSEHFHDRTGPAPAPSSIVAEYNYHDDAGALAYQVVRLEPKSFRQRQPNGAPGSWNWSTAGVKRWMYDRKRVLESEGVVFLVEGEKDAEALRDLGLVATTSSGGAKGWKASVEDGKAVLRDRDVCIIPDGDEDGLVYAEGWRSTLEGVAKSVRVAKLEWKDASYAIAAGATASTFLELWTKAETITPLVFAWVGVRELEKILPDVPYVCRGLKLSPGAVTLIAGYGYSGKTMASQALLVSLAAGRSVWGVWEAEGGPVGHLDYEQGRFLCQERMQRLARGMKVDTRELADDRYRLVSLPATYVKPESYDHLCRAFEGCKAVLVDSFRAACPGIDENSSDARIPLDVISRVGHALGAAMIVIHHARKTSDDDEKNADPKMVIRGSSAIFDAAQSAYVLVGRKNAPTVVHHVKDRFRGITLEQFGLSIVDPDARSVVVSHLDKEQLDVAAFAPEVDRFDKRTRSILEAVRAGATTSNDVWRRVRGDRNGVLKRVKEMLSERELAFVDGALRAV